MMERWTLPEGWGWKPMLEVCDINPERPRIQRTDETLTSFIPMQAVDDRSGTIINMQIRPYSKVKRGYTYFEENDVLMAKITPSMENGKAAIARNLIDGIGFGTTEFHVFHPHSNILPEWIFYFIRRKVFRDSAKMSFRGAVGQQRVPEEFLLAQEIPLPYPDAPERSLTEQRRIVARLEALLGEVKAMREQVQIMRRDVNRLMESALAEVFPSVGQPLPEGWGWKRVSEVATDTTRRNPQNEPDKLFHYVDIAAINNLEFRIVSEKVKVLQGKDAPSRARKVIRSGCIILATTRPYLKNIALVTDEFNNQICSTGFCVLCPNSENVDSRFLYHAVKANSFINQLIPKQRGANYPAVTDDDVFDSEIPLPYPDNPERSLAEQCRIVAYLDSIQEEVREAQKLLEADLRAIEQLEQSILAAAFRGEI